MPSDVTFVNVRKSFQAVAGLESMTEMDNFFFEQSLNRAVQRAYDSSESWSRYLVTGEERKISDFIVSNTLESDNLNGLYYKYGDDANGNAVYVPLNTRSGRAFNYDNSTNRWFLSAGSYSKNVETGVVTFTGASTLLTQRDSSVQYDNPWDVEWQQASGFIPQTERLQTIAYDELVDSFTNADAANSKTTIGEFIKIHRKKPFLNNSAIEYDFFVNKDGANILNISNSEDTSAFVTYKKKVSTYSETSTDVPSEFVDYIIYSVLSDFYTGDGQTEKALIASQTAEKMLEKELFKIDVKSNNNSTSRKFSTYVNRQSR